MYGADSLYLPTHDYCPVLTNIVNLAFTNTHSHLQAVNQSCLRNLHAEILPILQKWRMVQSISLDCYICKIVYHGKLILCKKGEVIW